MNADNGRVENVYEQNMFRKMKVCMFSTPLDRIYCTLCAVQLDWIVSIIHFVLFSSIGSYLLYTESYLLYTGSYLLYTGSYLLYTGSYLLYTGSYLLYTGSYLLYTICNANSLE